MANIRIDNASGDALRIELDGEEYFIPEDENINVSEFEKGSHGFTVYCVERNESAEEQHGEKENYVQKLSRGEKSQYVRLKGCFGINVISSKSVWTVKKKPLLIEKTGVDALFSGYELEITGGSITESRPCFADKKVRKAFLKKQLAEAFFPIGIGILILSILIINALLANIHGNPVTFGGRKFTYPWTFGLLAIDIGFIGYFTAMLVNIFLTDKRYK